MKNYTVNIAFKRGADFSVELLDQASAQEAKANGVYIARQNGFRAAIKKTSATVTGQ